MPVSIHAFRGEGDRRTGGAATRETIVSIHAFRGEGDRVAETLRVPGRMFQSTPSGGKATALCSVTHRSLLVSIHAFRGEGDR